MFNSNKKRSGLSISMLKMYKCIQSVLFHGEIALSQDDSLPRSRASEKNSPAILSPAKTMNAVTAAVITLRIAMPDDCPYVRIVAIIELATP